jgi:hypothetical protein
VYALVIAHVKLLDVNVRILEPTQELISGFVGELDIAARHDDVPAVLLRQVLNDPVPDAFVRACHDDVSQLLHIFLKE